MMMMMNEDNPVVELHAAGHYLFSYDDKRFIFLLRMSTFISIPILLHLSWLLFPMKPVFAFYSIILPLIVASYFIEGEMDFYMRYLDNSLDIVDLHQSQRMRLLKLCTLLAMVLMLWFSPAMGLLDVPLICKHAKMGSVGGIKNNLVSLEPCCRIPSPPPFVATDHSHGSCSEEVLDLCPVEPLKEVMFRDIMSDNDKEEEEEKGTSATLKFNMFCKWYRFRVTAMLIACVIEDLWVKKVKRVIANIYARTRLVWAFFHEFEW